MPGRPATSPCRNPPASRSQLKARPTQKEMVAIAEIVAALSRRSRASALGLLSRGETARRRVIQTTPKTKPKAKSKAAKPAAANGKRNGMAGLSGPSLEPKSGKTKRLVVFLHGYGADGNDLIDIGRAWQPILPDTAFVSPHAPEPCGQAPVGRQWFGLTFRDPDERWVGVNQAAPALQRIPRRRIDAPAIAAGRAGAGRLQPGHHDVAACRACAGRSRPKAIVGYSGMFIMPNDGPPEDGREGDRLTPAGAADPRRPATN